MSRIKNREALLSTGEVELRRLALDIAEAGLAAADPSLVVRRHLQLDGDVLREWVIGASICPARNEFSSSVRVRLPLPIAKAIEEVLSAAAL